MGPHRSRASRAGNVLVVAHAVTVLVVAALFLSGHAAIAGASAREAPAVIPAQSAPTVLASVSCGANPTCTTPGFNVASGDVLVFLTSGTGNTGQPTDSSSDESIAQVGTTCYNPDDSGREITAWVELTPNYPETGETATFSDATSSWDSGAVLVLSGGNTVAVGDCEGADNATAWASVTGGTPGDDLTIGVFGQDDSGCGTPTTAATSVFLICNGAGSYAMFGSYATTAASPDTQSWTLSASYDWGGFVFAFGSAPPASQCSIGAPVPFNSTYVEGTFAVYANTTFDDPPYEYTIDWGDSSSPTVVDSSAASVSPTHEYTLTPPYPDAFSVSLTVDDTTPAETTCGVTLYAYPATDLSAIAYSPGSPTANASTYWTATLSTAIGAYNWSWSWGDGSWTNGTNTTGFAQYNDSHLYGAAGAYDVTLNVTDWAGYWSFQEVTLHVANATKGTGPPPCVDCVVTGPSSAISQTEFYLAVGAVIVVVIVLLAALSGARRD
jgi:hypothetical protein